jgi:superoxide dismutase
VNTRAIHADAMMATADSLHHLPPFPYAVDALESCIDARTMTPHSTGLPDGRLRDALDSSLGNVAAFKASFEAADAH